MSNNQTTTFFTKQFPNGDQTEIVTACYSLEKKAYVNFDLNIGWQLETVYSRDFKKESRRVYSKRCLGAVFCSNSDCPLFFLERRPASAVEKIRKQECDGCQQLVSRKFVMRKSNLFSKISLPV